MAVSCKHFFDLVTNFWVLLYHSYCQQIYDKNNFSHLHKLSSPFGPIEVVNLLKYVTDIL